MLLKNLFYSLFFLLLFFLSTGSVSAATYYISPSGSDTNAGTQSSPFKTFQKSVSVLSPGDVLKVFPGTYADRLHINTNGTNSSWIEISPVSGRPIIDGSFSREPLDINGDYIKISGLEITKGQNYCVNVDESSQNTLIDNLKIHNCNGHGINIDGQNLTMQNSEVFRTNLNHAQTSASSGWGSGIKGHFGAANLTIKNNTVYHNYGEGIAMTRVKGAVVENNTSYDNFAVNIYIDNSYDIVVRNNFTYYTSNSEYYKDGKKGRCIELAEEYYSGWGAQMNNIEVYNNIASDCYYGITFFDGGQNGSAIRNMSIHNNILWNIERTGTSIDPLPTEGTNAYYKNIIYSTRGVDIWTDLTSGINFNTNLWVSGEPSVSIANGNNDQYGQPEFATTPSLTDPNSYKLNTSSAAYQAGIGPFQNGFSTVIGATQLTQTTPTPSPSPSPSPEITPSPLPSPPQGCTYQQVQCIQAPCDPILVCASPNPTPSPEACSEDINLDGIVDIQDYTILIGDFFSTNPNNTRSDINADGSINILDYTLLSNRFFDSC